MNQLKITTVQTDDEPQEDYSSTSSSELSSDFDNKKRDIWERLRKEALDVEKNEPELGVLLKRTVLAPGVKSFEDAVANTVCYRLLLQPFCPKKQQQQQAQGGGGGGMMNMNNMMMMNGTGVMEPSSMFCPDSLRALVRQTMDSKLLEMGNTMASAIRADAIAVYRRDPAVNSILEVILFVKGYAALVCHRAAHRLWIEEKRKFTALFLQSQASAVFGLDLHPLTQIGKSVMLDHGTGVVMGETATVGDGCTILHGVTLGGTGKEHGDRHPKIGKNVLIGANSSLLGNIIIGDGAKIGAGSVVLRPIPPHATAVGVPAKIIGRASELKPGSVIDEQLHNVSLLHKSESIATMPSLSELSSSGDDSGGSDADQQQRRHIRRSTIASNIGKSGCCPWREYRQMAKTAPPGSVTILKLAKALESINNNISSDEIGATFFELDKYDVGYIKINYFHDHALNAIMKYTKLDENDAKKVISMIVR